MTTQDQSPPKQGKARSPAYPAVSLASAIDLARKLWTAQRKHEAHIDSALKSLGYGARSGTALRAISALNQYGLIDESGAKDGRKIRLSELAQDILLRHESDQERVNALKKAAVLPTIHNALWERYGGQLPDDSLISPFLTREKNFNEAVVDTLLENYRATLEFAKLDKLGEDSPHDNRADTRAKRRTRGFLPENADAESEADEMTLDQELPILVGDNRVARIPFPMTEDDFDLLLGTLNLWKKKLLSAKPTPDAKGETASADDQS
ncbi:MAG: hypothetical protein V7609_63 [Verrucomicrobiota bacterium]